MFPYTHRNHFQFGYNGRPFADRSHPSDQFTVAYGSCSRRPGDFRAECLRAARLVRDSTDLPIDVLFSGGVDSEVVVRSFVAAGVAFRVVILRFAGGLNAHDIRYAVEYCEQAGLVYSFVDLDLLDFWENGLLDYARVSSCVSPQLCTTMWLCDQVDGLPVIGAGECYLAIDSVKGAPDGCVARGEPGDRGAAWNLWEREKVAAWYRFFVNTGRTGLGGFFQYTPELMYAFLVDEWTRRLVRCEVQGAVDNAPTKFQVYNRYFDLRPRPKYTGFERVAAADQIYRSQLEKLFPTADQVVKTEYGVLLDHLGGDVAPPDGEA